MRLFAILMIALVAIFGGFIAPATTSAATTYAPTLSLTCPASIKAGNKLECTGTSTAPSGYRVDVQICDSSSTSVCTPLSDLSTKVTVTYTAPKVAKQPKGSLAVVLVSRVYDRYGNLVGPPGGWTKSAIVKVNP